MGSLAGLAGCHPADPLRVGAHPFPSYGLLFMARQRGWLGEAQARLIETPSASASIRALGAGALEAACLTLDETLAAREAGVPLVVVAVLDVSVGADALLARPDIEALAALRGRTVGVEKSSVGAVMLDAVLQAARLRPADVRLRYVPGDEHEAEFAAGRVDAVVTYEPHLARLRARGARLLFSSADVPGRVVDVLVVRAAVLDTGPQAVAALVAAYFRAQQAFQAEGRSDQTLARHIGVAPEALAGQFEGLELLDRTANRAWLGDDAARLKASARTLGSAMAVAGLLRRPPLLNHFADARFVTG